LYNLFSRAIERPVKNELEQAICAAASVALSTSGNDQLRSIAADVPLRSGYSVDCSIIDNPIFATGYMETSNKGEAYVPGEPRSTPLFTADPIQTSTTSSKMITIYLSQYMANTIGYLLQQRNVLSYSLTRDDVQNTTFFSTTCSTGPCFGTLFPNAQTLFPNSHVELRMATTEPPTLTIAPSAATGRFRGNMDVVVRQADGASRSILSLEVGFETEVSVEVQGSMLKAQVTTLSPSVTVLHSQIGNNPQASQLNELVQFLATNFIIPKLNEVGEEGIQVPNMYGVEFVDPTLRKIQGAIEFSTNLRYLPTSL